MVDRSKKLSLKNVLKTVYHMKLHYRVRLCVEVTVMQILNGKFSLSAETRQSEEKRGAHFKVSNIISLN